MPSNLFVVIFPRKVQAHTVFVTRREKPKSKWGGLRSPPGVFSVRDGRHHKGDEKGGKKADSQQIAQQLASVALSGSSSSGSSNNDRSHAGGSSARDSNELNNQKTVRIQLSRPTDEVEPESDSVGSSHNVLANIPYTSNHSCTHHSQSQSRRRTFSGTSAEVDEFSGVGAGVGVRSARSSRSSSYGGPGGGSNSGGSGQTPGDLINDVVRSEAFAAGAVALERETSGVYGDGPSTPAVGVVTGMGVDRNKGRDGAGIGEFVCLTSGAAVVGQPERRGSLGTGSGGGGVGLLSGGEGEVGEDGLPLEGAMMGGMFSVPAGYYGAGGGGYSEAKNDQDASGVQVKFADDREGGKRKGEVTEVIGDDDVDVSKPEDIDDGEKVDIERLVRGVLADTRTDQLLIGEPTFHISAGGKLMTCIFPCDGDHSHFILTKLESVGVGSEVGSVNVLPMEIGRSDITRRRAGEMSARQAEKSERRRRKKSEKQRLQAEAAGGSAFASTREGLGGDTGRDGGRAGGVGAGSGSGVGGVNKSAAEEEAKRRVNDKFLALASQIRVSQVTEEIREGTKFHFDYIALLIASSAISAMGLATDNVAVVVAAMLVSPIMGPVLAFTFGTNVRDWSLTKKGFLVESFSLLICVLVGGVTGVFSVFFVDETTWPTHEMESRGDAWGLLTGCAIAIPSGMAVALSILSKNVNSLVGVAISASLLPPAVNTGLCLSFALLGPTYVKFDFDTMEYFRIALISMSLTVVNIVCIYLAGVSLFLFKEVAPIKSENSFWSKDMIRIRKVHQTLTKRHNEGGEASRKIRKQLLAEAKRQKTRGDGDGKDLPDDNKLSYSSNTNTHHRYRYKDRRRRPTVFDLFGDSSMAGQDAETDIDLDPDASPSEVAATVLREREAREAIKRESSKSEGSGGGLRGLVPAAALRQMAKLLDRGDGGDGDDALLTRRSFQSLLNGGSGGGGGGGGPGVGGGVIPATSGGTVAVESGKEAVTSIAEVT